MSFPDIDEADVQGVVDVLRSGRLALGPKTDELERNLADYVGASHAVAVNSGTAALHVALRALGVGPGDEVLVPSFTFAASVNAILYERATPVFVDIEPDTYNLSPEDLERRIGPRSRAILAVDVFGHPAEWDAITAVAGSRGLELIDDSCEALGAEYRGRKLGRFGRASAFAFYPNKLITTGEGGALVTDDGELAGTARSLRNHGRESTGAWLRHERLGFNYRLSELGAALGVTQLARVETLLAERARVAGLYTARLGGRSWVRPPVVRPHVRMGWFVYVATLAEGLDRDRVARTMEARGIPVRTYFPPVHLQPYVRELVGTAHAGLPVTESVAERTIALPFHGKLTSEEVDRVVETLADAVGVARAVG